jgi:hypothetical protein
MSGPLSSIKKHCKKYVEIKKGNMKTSDVAKKIKKKFNYNNLDEIIRIIPVGSSL